MTTYSWTSAASADWASATAWTPAGPPDAAADDAVIIVAGSYTVTLAAGESFVLGQLTFDPGTNATLALNGVLTLAAMTQTSGTIALAGTIAGGALTLAGGVLADVGAGLISGAVTLGGAAVSIASAQTLTLSGAVVWAGSTLDGPGTLLTTGTSTLAAGTDLDGALNWINTGTVLISNRIYDHSAANRFVNQASGTVDVTADGFQAFITVPNVAPTNFVNAGLLEKTGGTGNASVWASVASTGTITSASGTLELDRGGTLGGAVGGTGGGVVQLGTPVGFATTGTLTILDAGNSNGMRLVNGADWTDSGTIDDAGRLLLGNGTSVTLTVAAGGNLDFTGDDGNIVYGGGNTLINAGVIAKIGGAGTNTIGLGFYNSGTVDAASGTLKLLAGVADTGTLQIGAGATLELVSGAIVNSNTIAFTGLGATLKIDSLSGIGHAIVGLTGGSRIDLAAATGASATINGNVLAITPVGGVPLNFSGAASLAGLRAAVGSGSALMTLYNEATATLAQPVAFGHVHVGAVAAKTLSLTNAAPANAYSEALDATIVSNASGFGAAGSVTGLAAGASNGTALTVTLNTGLAGVIAGAATVTLASDGTGIDGLGEVALPTQTVNVTGTVYAYALPVLSRAVIALGAARVGGAALSSSVTLTDGTFASLYQESLVYAFAGTPAGLSISNAAGTLAAGHAATIGVSLATSTAGAFTDSPGGAFVSTGAGTSLLADSSVAAPSLTVTGSVFAAATADLSGTSVTFGVVHVGDIVTAETLSVTNAASGALTDLLTAGTIGRTGFYTGSVTESLGAGITTGSVMFGLSTAKAGVQSGTVSLGFRSHDTLLADLALAAVPVTVGGTVDNYATAAITAFGAQIVSLSATAKTINLGILQQNSGPAVITLKAINSAVGQADRLAGSFTVAAAAGFTTAGFAAFSGLAAGQAAGSDTVTLATANTGTFSETVTLHPVGSNADFSGALAAQTLTITGIVANSHTIGPTYVLTPAPVTILATVGNDTFIATNGALNSRDNLTGGPGGTNTLDLSGGGVFDLNAPQTLANIQLVDASTGIVFLRDGLNVMLNVAADAGGITIYGGDDASVLNLGTGSDTVILGSAAETVNGGGGAALVQATAGFAGALVKGTAAGQTTLEITTGGAAALKAGTTYVTVKLDRATHLTLNKMGFITAIGQVAGNTITAGGAGQTLGGQAGGDTLIGFSGFGDMFAGSSAGLNGDTIESFGGSDKIDLTDIAPTTLPGYAGNATQGTLTLDDGTHHASLTMLGDFSRAHFHVVTDGHSGSLVSYS